MTYFHCSRLFLFIQPSKQTWIIASDRRGSCALSNCSRFRSASSASAEYHDYIDNITIIITIIISIIVVTITIVSIKISISITIVITAAGSAPPPPPRPSGRVRNHVHIYIHISLSLHIYIYIYRERESWGGGGALGPCSCGKEAGSLAERNILLSLPSLLQLLSSLVLVLVSL